MIAATDFPLPPAKDNGSIQQGRAVKRGPAGSTNRFDPNKESAVVGTITGGLFDRIPVSRLISPKAFTDRKCQIIYDAALSLRRAGIPVCRESVSDFIAENHLDGELQRLLAPSNTVSWRDWPDFFDQSLAFSGTAPVEYSLEVLGELYEKREAVEIAKQIESGEISPHDAIEALREIAPESREPPEARPLIEFGDTSPDPEKTLLGDRFLCREGGMLFVGPSGIGKTSASVQQDLLWSVGLPAFGITPARPLKVLAIQAEDDDGDLSEIVCGVRAGLRLTPEQCEQSRENCLYVTEKSHTGLEFLEKVVRPLLEKHRPDLLRINPLQAYLGGDIKNPEITAAFLRNGLNPLLAEFQCGCIIVHHTPKVTFRDTKEWKASDWMYAGAGAADIIN